jgi:hypothetical protein
MKIALSTAVFVGGLLFSQFASAASIATCQGVPAKTIAAATASAQSQVCSHIALIAAGVELESKKQLRADAQTIFASLETQFNLPPLGPGVPCE